MSDGRRITELIARVAALEARTGSFEHASIPQQSVEPDGANLTFVTGAPVLLDYTDPTSPTFVEAGVYAISAAVYSFDGNFPGKTYGVILGVNDGLGDVNGTLEADLPLVAPGAADRPVNSLTLVAPQPAGGSFGVLVFHDNDVAITISGDVYITRIC